MLIKPQLIHPSWYEFFTDEIVEELRKIELHIGTDYQPSAEKVLHFTQLDLQKVRIVILGQDPYPQAGIATGRAFEVNGLIDWESKIRQASIKNILKLLYKSYNDKYLSLALLRDAIRCKKFNILPPNRIFAGWEEQGVLLLNRTLTCETNNSNSHKVVWTDFSNKLIKYINDKNAHLIWFLWGNDAITTMKKYNNITSYCSHHPMLVNLLDEESFIHSKCFSETKTFINWLGV